MIIPNRIGQNFTMSSKATAPCSVDRIETRKKAWDDGAWVREALMAHSEKQKTKVAAE